MKRNKPLAMLSPLCLALIAGNACAALEPFTLGASENVQHHSNLNHTADGEEMSDRISTTEFNAALDQALGRDKLVASLAVDFNRYKRSHSLNSTGYQAAAEFDWNTVGDLSGALGASSLRRQYIAGETGEVVSGSTDPTIINQRNLQTDNHAFANIALGGESRWTIFGGVDANQRRYSLADFRFNDEHQWSTHAGTRYSTSPDLSFGLTGNYVHGEYPGGAEPTGQGFSLFVPASRFVTRSIDATTKWQASGNSALDASVGYTTETNDQLTSDRKFVNGSLNWSWKPPSHFSVILGLKRSSDADSPFGGLNAGVANTGNLNGTSINNVAHLEVVYALTAKVSLDASGDYTQRKYSGLKVGDADVAGTTNTSGFLLTAHYQPTRTTDVSCGAGREKRTGQVLLPVANPPGSPPKNLLPGYTDNYLQCMASIKFD